MTERPGCTCLRWRGQMIPDHFMYHEWECPYKQWALYVQPYEEEKRRQDEGFRAYKAAMREARSREAKQ